MSRAAAPTSITRVTVLVALLSVTVIVALLLAYEAVDAARSQRVTVSRALRDYATVAGWELQAAARKRVESVLQRSLSPAVTGSALSPYEALLPLDLVVAPATSVLPCTSGLADTTRSYLRVDLRDNSVVTAGSGLSVDDRTALADAARSYAQTRASPEQPFGLVHGALGASGPALAVGVKYARHNAPLAAYAFTVCPSAFGAPLVARVLAEHPLLPSAVRGELPNDSLLAVEVYLGRADSTPVLVTAPVTSPYASTVVLDSAAGTRAMVSVREPGVSRLFVDRPSSSRVPVLIALLVLTVALALVALFQLRREHDLARLRTDFTSSVSHELRTPLAQILLFGETLSLGRVRDEGEGRLAAATIVTEARRLMRMVDNILVFERSRRAPLRSGTERVSVTELTREVVASFAPLAQANQATVVVQTREAHDGWAVSDRAMLRQVLLNLLDNAMKYGPAGQVVRVEVREAPADDEVWISVCDEGPGVPPSEVERIFSPYVRLDRGPSSSGGAVPVRPDGGSGLGLAVVRDLVTALGGRVWVEDGAGVAQPRDGKGNGREVAGPGCRRGACFVVALPRSGPGAPPRFQDTAPSSAHPHHSNAAPPLAPPRGALDPHS